MYKKITCDVIIDETNNVSNIRLFDNGKLDWYGKDIIGGKNVVVYFRTKTGHILATSNNDEFPNIGLDFIWPFIQNNKKNASVNVSVTDNYPLDLPSLVMAQSLNVINPNPLICDHVKLHKNGTIMVSRCDEMEYSERDVTTMLMRALSHSKATVKEILNWFKDISE